MKKLLSLGICVVALAAFTDVAKAADAPLKQEGRVWIEQNLTLVFSPEWSLTAMPGARAEYARSREGMAGMQFLEFFFGPNYTYKSGNLTIKGSLWYYYMGYPQRGREIPGKAFDCSTAPMNPDASLYCTSTYNFSHNIEFIPSISYQFGRWSLFNRMIFHNTFYADTYSTPYKNGTSTLSVADQRLGWGTVLRELVQLRYAVTDRLGAFISDELFVTLIEDGDTSGMKNATTGAPTGYTPLGYWKSGLRYNRTYLGVDYKVAPNFTIAPMYMVEIGLSPTDSSDITDLAHTFFMVATVTAATFDPPKK